jgi:hypothetical protein
MEPPHPMKTCLKCRFHELRSKDNAAGISRKKAGSAPDQHDSCQEI